MGLQFTHKKGGHTYVYQFFSKNPEAWSYLTPLFSSLYNMISQQHQRQQNNGLTYEHEVALGRKAHPKKRDTFVLSKEQTLVNLFRNNSLACMGDFKRAICIFLFMHAPFIFILLPYNLLQSNLWNIFNNNSLQDYFCHIIRQIWVFYGVCGAAARG